LYVIAEKEREGECTMPNKANTASVSAWKDGFARKELAQDASDTPKIHALGKLYGIQTQVTL
jgi:hypothetical protein